MHQQKRFTTWPGWCVILVVAFTLSHDASGQSVGVIEYRLHRNPMELPILDRLALRPEERRVINVAWMGYQRRLTALEEEIRSRIDDLLSPEIDEDRLPPEECARRVRSLHRVRIAARQRADHALGVLVIGVEAALEKRFADQAPRVRRAIRRAVVFEHRTGLRKQDFSFVPDVVQILDEVLLTLRGKVGPEIWMQLVTLRDEFAVATDRRIPGWWYARQDRLQNLRILRETGRHNRYMSVREDGRRLKYEMYQSQWFYIDAVGQMLFSIGEHRAAHDLYDRFFSGWLLTWCQTKSPQASSRCLRTTGTFTVRSCAHNSRRSHARTASTA